MKKLTILTLVTILILAAGPAAAANFSPRAFGMGGTFTGVADDVSAVLYNPAGVTKSGVLGLKTFGGFSTEDFQSMKDTLNIIEDSSGMKPDIIYDNFPSDVDLNGNAFAGANLKSLALSLNSKAQVGLNKYKAENRIEANMDTQSEAALTLGNSLVDPPLNIGTLSYGANLKMIKFIEKKYEIKDFNNTPKKTVRKRKGQSFGLDIGVLANVTDLITVGAQIDNLWAGKYDLEKTKTEYNYTINETWDEIDSTTATVQGNKLERTMRVGASVQVPVIGTTLAADIENFPLMTEGNKEMVYHYGVEQNLILNLLSLRAGTYTQPQKESKYYTFGMGLNILTAHVNLGVGSDDGFKDSITGVLSGNIQF